jgi:hypothetical protein
VAFKKVLISNLNKCDYNPRKISKKRLDRLAASVKEHSSSLVGWDTSDGYRLAATITVNKKGSRIVGGHQRVEALQALGQDWVHESDITWVDLSPDSAEEKALNVSLNDTKAGGQWDDGKLKELLDDVKSKDSDLFESLTFEELSSSLKELDAKSSSDSIKSAGDDAVLVKDSVSFIVQEILSKYGATIPQGFIFFAHKNRLHLLVQCDEDLYELTKGVADGLKRDTAAINDFLKSSFSAGMKLAKWDDILKGVLSRQCEPVSPEEVEN